MSAPRVARLASRGVLHVTGEDAATFLDRVVTADVDAIPADTAGYGALLSPQGKVLSDFLLVAVDDGFLIDCPRAAAPDLLKRLGLYRLRAKVGLEDVSDRLAVLALWDVEAPPRMPGRTVRDPRHPALGFRSIVPASAVGPAEAFEGAEIEPEDAYAVHRAGLGIPEVGSEVGFGEAFPHEIAMDALSGVSFDKGCYVGQEVVSRMEHRATARRRPVIVAAQAPLPDTGTEILAGERPAGALGTAHGHRGMAIVRLDRIAEARAAGAPVSCGGVPVEVAIPDWAPWGWPATDGG